MRAMIKNGLVAPLQTRGLLPGPLGIARLASSPHSGGAPTQTELEDMRAQIKQATGLAQEAGARAQRAEGQAQEAAARAQRAEGQAQEANARAQEANARAQEANARAQDAQERLHPLEEAFVDNVAHAGLKAVAEKTGTSRAGPRPRGAQLVDYMKPAVVDKLAAMTELEPLAFVEGARAMSAARNLTAHPPNLPPAVARSALMCKRFGEPPFACRSIGALPAAIKEYDL